MELRDKIEALLFASGRKMELEEIGKLVKVRDTNIIRDKLFELKKHYEDKNSSIVVMEEGNSWKLTTHEQYIEFLINKFVDLFNTNDEKERLKRQNRKRLKAKQEEILQDKHRQSEKKETRKRIDFKNIEKYI